LEPIIWENTNAKTTDSVPILCSGKSDVSDRFSDSRCAHTWGVEQRSAGERKGEKEHGDYGSKEVFEGRGNRPTSCGVSIPQL